MFKQTDREIFAKFVEKDLFCNRGYGINAYFEIRAHYMWTEITFALFNIIFFKIKFTRKYIYHDNQG